MVVKHWNRFDEISWITMGQTHISSVSGRFDRLSVICFHKECWFALIFILRYNPSFLNVHWFCNFVSLVNLYSSNPFSLLFIFFYLFIFTKKSLPFIVSCSPDSMTFLISNVDIATHRRHLRHYLISLSFSIHSSCQVFFAHCFFNLIFNTCRTMSQGMGQILGKDEFIIHGVLGSQRRVLFQRGRSLIRLSQLRLYLQLW